MASGGFVKYRCKYWSSHECDNWVYVKNEPCANCQANGRDEEMPLVADAFEPRITEALSVQDIGLDYPYMAMKQGSALEMDKAWVPCEGSVTPLWLG